jgi:AcrR family transcriptional regulator
MDGTPRGLHLLDTMVELIGSGGLEAVTMRRVAAAANVSPAQVQYYFTTKDQLVAAAFRHVTDNVVRQVRSIDLPADTLDALRHVLALWLPLTESQARDARVWLSFTAAAATSPTLREIAVEVDDSLRRWFTDLLRAGQRRGDIEPELDPEMAATLLLAVVDGLVTQSLVLPSEQRAPLLDAALNTHLSTLRPASAPERMK